MYMYKNLSFKTSSFQVNFPNTKILPFKDLRKSQELGLKGFLHMIIKA